MASLSDLVTPSQSARREITKRGRHNSNIWFLNSPKTNVRLVIKGDLAFRLVIVKCEAARNVSTYELEGPTVFGQDAKEVRRTTYDVRPLLDDGHVERWEFKFSKDAGPARTGRSVGQLQAQASAALVAGEPYRVFTELDLKGTEVQFDNWLLLCGAMNRARRYPLWQEFQEIKRLLDWHGDLPLGDILVAQEMDPALMLAAVARGLQKGIFDSNLETQLLSLSTRIARRLA